MKIRVRNTAKDWCMAAVFYLLLFQDALAVHMPVFAYTDELFALAGMVTVLYKTVKKGKINLRKSTGWMLLLFLVFVAVGLIGNLIYRYQPVAAVMIDLFTNMKFYLAAITGYMLFQRYDSARDHDVLVVHAKLMAVVFFALLLADQFFEVFESTEVRYGFRVSKLMYYQPTYLAGAVIFLISVMTAFYRKSNLLYIAMCLCVLIFTFRGKAIAGAAVYCLIFYFIVIYRKKLKMWHFLLIGLVTVAVAGEQFAYYYLELEGRSARSALTQTSLQILKDYFPIGTGFGTFASATAAEYYSPVYFKYGINTVHGLSESNVMFTSDTFWPIIMGQTGVIGTVCYFTVLMMLLLRVLKARKENIHAYAAGIFIFVYLIISSTSEPAFNNAIAVPLAMIVGYILSLERRNSNSPA